MNIFEYLPKLIVAYDGNDEFSNLIHIKTATRDTIYYCPCCGGIVKPQSLISTKEQPFFHHITGKCAKESQHLFFCKNWLFEKGSKFYINDKIFEVNSIDIEKIWNTPFGEYKPDITVYTSSGETIFFEMFFSNRKKGDDYFCKWNSLKNDVVEVNIKEYLYKTNKNIIPAFSYLYHNEICFSKSYIKRDLYANTIARTKQELARKKDDNYKSRIEQLDRFWQKVSMNQHRESILEVVMSMEYEDMISCYNVIKRKQCVSFLKKEILKLIYQKVIYEIRNDLNFPYDENIFFDLKHIRGETYQAGIRLNLKTHHIIYNDIYSIKNYPKIVFNKKIHRICEINISPKEIEELKKIFEYVVQYKKHIIAYEKDIAKFEGERYKIHMKNNYYTILTKSHDNNYEILLKNFYMKELDIKKLSKEIKRCTRNKEFLNTILHDKKYHLFVSELDNYKKLDCIIDLKYDYKLVSSSDDLSCIRFKLYIHHKVFYNKILKLNFDDFINCINDCKSIIDKLVESHSLIINIVNKINECKNNFWKAEVLFDFNGNPEIKINQKLFEVKKTYLLTYEKIYFDDLKIITEQEILKRITDAMYRVFKNMEQSGYRVMEVHN